MTSIFNFIRGLGFSRGPNRIIAGIAGGIARHLGVSTGVVRLIMLIVFLVPGLGVGTYLVVWLLTPNSMGGIPLERFLDGWHGRA